MINIPLGDLEKRNHQPSKGPKMRHSEPFKDDLRILRDEVSLLKQGLEEQQGNDFIRTFSSSDPVVEAEVGQFPERMAEHLTRIEATINEIREEPPEDRLALQLPLTVRTAILEAEAAVAAAEYTGTATTTTGTAPAAAASGFISWVNQVVLPALNKILGTAWNILAKLVTPKGWKIKGKLGNTFLGLASAEIEISFGS